MLKKDAKMSIRAPSLLSTKASNALTLGGAIIALVKS